MTYNEKNSHPRDCLLHFRAEDHVYTFQGRELKSVTTLVDECFPKFDADYWAPVVARREGVSEAEIRERWEKNACRARDLGTEMHANIEHYYLSGELARDFDTRSLFEQFIAGKTLYPYRTEWAVFDEDLGVAGTIDFLECRNGEFHVYDWKRSDKVMDKYLGRPLKENRYGKKGYGAMRDVDDTSYWHYALQLSIYRYILSRKYGIQATGSSLVVLHPNNRMPYVVDVPYLERELEELFRGR